MDAGVPLRAPVAGIAMGLVKEDDGYAVLTDILSDEDHLGDMVQSCWLSDGVTALQMDIKIQGITEGSCVSRWLRRRTLVCILGEMNKVIDCARDEVADTAPRTYSFRIDPDKIREVIGKGGATIRCCEASGDCRS